MPSTPKLNVVIAGGSLGGLIHGIVLARNGHNVTILERNVTPSMSGLGAELSCSVDMVDFMSLYDLTGKPYTLWDTPYYRLRANFDGLKSSYCEVPANSIRAVGQLCIRMDVQLRTSSTKKVLSTWRWSTVTVQEILKTVKADLLIATDGPSSKIRQILLPDVERTYVGYIGWRGTVHEKEISAKSKEGLSEIPTLCPIDNTCTISVFNWVWYRHCRFNSPEYQSLMTDSLTHTPHRYTLPLGRLLPQHATQIKAEAEQRLAPCIAELISKTTQPFIQAITDLVSPKAVFCDGKVLLAGDAVATLRPMSGLGTNSAARSAMRLLELLEGKMGLGEWERDVLEFSGKSREIGLQRCGGLGLQKSAEEAEAAERSLTSKIWLSEV